MNGIIRFLLSGLAVLLTAYILPGVHVEHYGYALLAALLISLANIFVGNTDDSHHHLYFGALFTCY
jgi:putative membrane protein